MKALWIRVDAHKVDSREVCDLADALGIDVVLALGHIVALGGAVAEHTDDGNIAGVSATALERWARWGGKRGAFADALRRLFQSDEGEYDHWRDGMGKLVERRARDRERKDSGSSTETRRKVRGSSTETGRDSAATVRDGTGRKEISLAHSSKERSGDLDPDTTRAPASAPASARERSGSAAAPLGFATLPKDVVAFGARFYGAADPERRRDVADQLLALANGGTVDYRGAPVAAGSLDRLIAACRAVRKLNDPNAAIAVLLTKLNDSTDLTSAQVEHDKADRAVDERATREQLRHAAAWLDEHSSIAAAIDADLETRGFDPANPFAAVSRSLMRDNLVLAAWRDAGAPELTHAG